MSSFILLILMFDIISTTALVIIKPPSGIEMIPCDNDIVWNIPGNVTTVLKHGAMYVDSMLANEPFEGFQGAWRSEPRRAIRTLIPECSNFKVFGDLANKDGTKNFCYPATRKRIKNDSSGTVYQCKAYSVGSANDWSFEENFFNETDCTIDTFDCTIEPKMPPRISNRTKFWKICLDTGRSNDPSYLNLENINKLLGTIEGPDYFKIDIEGYEWGVLKSMMNEAFLNPSLHSQLPLQISGELHLEWDFLPDDRVIKTKGWSREAHLGRNHAYVGKKLRNFFDMMFIKGGYMVMHNKDAVYPQSTEILFTKVFCPVLNQTSPKLASSQDEISKLSNEIKIRYNSLAGAKRIIGIQQLEIEKLKSEIERLEALRKASESDV